MKRRGRVTVVQEDPTEEEAPAGPVPPQSEPSDDRDDDEGLRPDALYARTQAPEEVEPEEEEQEPEVPRPAPARPAPRMRPRVAPPRPGSPVLGQIERDEHRALKDLMDELGTQGSFRISLTRLEPKTIRIRGKDVTCSGFLESYDKAIDEDFIKSEWGGGKFELSVKLRAPSGSYQYAKGYHRTVVIAGEPNPDKLVNVPPESPVQQSQAPAGDSPGLVTAAFGLVRDQLNQRQQGGEISPTVQAMFDQHREDTREARREAAELRQELAAARSAKPAEDPIKDKILSNLLDGNNGHVEALRTRLESELRQTKDEASRDRQRLLDQQAEELKRVYDRGERDRDEVKRGFEREIATLRQAHELALASAKSSHDVQLHVLRGENTRLQREVDDLRVDVKELRAKKEKTIIESVKELETVKDALGLGGDSESKTWFDKAMEVATSPMAGEVVGRLVGNGQATAAAHAQAAAPPVQVRAMPQRPRIMRDPNTGQQFAVAPDGSRRPVKRKQQMAVAAVTTPEGEVVTPAIPMPEVDAVQLAQIVTLLEGAYAAGQDPEVVAQGARTNAPALVQWIVENHTEQVAGVDLFMDKVAKLPSTSPLRMQAGKNWLRKVGKALVGG